MMIFPRKDFKLTTLKSFVYFAQFKYLKLPRIANPKKPQTCRPTEQLKLIRKSNTHMLNLITVSQLLKNVTVEVRNRKCQKWFQPAFKS